MRTKKTPLIAALAATAVLAGCAGAAEAGIVRSDVAYEPRTLQEAGSVPGVVGATGDAGLALLGAAATEDEPAALTTVVSPASLMVALSMLAEGAEGQTAAAFDEVFGASGQDRSDAINALMHALAEFEGDPALVQDIDDGDDLPDEPLLHLANQVVIDEGFEVHEEYLDALARSYDAGVQFADLGSEDGIEVLSAWAEEHTGGLIPESAIEPDEDLRLVWQNAVVMVAAWQTPFDPNLTAPRDFHLGDQSVSAEMLSGLQSAAYATSGDWEAIRLPYTAGFAADVILPPVGTDPAQIDDATLTELTDSLDEATPQQVAVVMPTLDVSTEPLDLRDSLEAMGLESLFNGPDLSGISATGLELDQTFQQAVLQINEQGTVAAALTELGAVETSAPAVDQEFTADRPYLVRIAHTETQWPLFLAAVQDPR